MRRGVAEELALLRGKLPPIAQWNPSHCGRIDIRIARDGTWFHEGSPIQRPELMRLFSTVLRKEADGFYLVTPAEKLQITVEDAPFVAVLLRSEGQGRDQILVFTTNAGDEVAAGPEHALRLRGEHPAPYLDVRDGLEAVIARAVFYQLAELAVPDDNGVLGVWSQGVFFPLGSA